MGCQILITLTDNDYFTQATYPPAAEPQQK